MHSQQLGKLPAPSRLQRAGATPRRVLLDTQQASAAPVKEPHQRTALVTPPSLHAALVARLTADISSLPQLDPLSSLEDCPSLHQGPSFLEQPGSKPSDFFRLVQQPILPQQHLDATIYEPRPRSQKPDKDPRGEDFYANVGYAIRTLRDELPTLFQEDLSYDIYRDDIAFKDPRNCIEGKKNYRTIFWSLRFHGALFFTRLTVDVQRIWQPEEALIKARWTVRGEPRVPWRAVGTFDGISEFKLDSNGKIYQHKVDNTILSDPPYIGLPIFGLNLLGRPAVQPQTPVPGGWFRNAPRNLLPDRSSSQKSSSSSMSGSANGPNGPSTPAPV